MDNSGNLSPLDMTINTILRNPNLTEDPELVSKYITLLKQIEIEDNLEEGDTSEIVVTQDKIDARMWILKYTAPHIYGEILREKESSNAE